VSGALNVSRRTMSLYTTVDLAFSSKSGADYTAIAVWGFTNAHLWLLDVVRDRWTERELSRALGRVEEEWGVGVHWVEEGAFKIGAGTIAYLRECGHPIRVLDASKGTSKDKEQRAHDATPRMEDARVIFPASAPWWDVFEAEVLSFPHAAHDDQVDVLSYGVLSAPWDSMREPVTFAARRETAPSYNAIRPEGW